jgi:predicted permease
VADYARRLKLPAYTALLGRARRERYLEPAYNDLLEALLRELDGAPRAWTRACVRLRFQWQVLQLAVSCLPLSSPGETAPRPWPALTPTAHDLRAGVRALRRHPLLTLTVAAVLALGIGASTAVLSGVRAVLSRPLPYPHPERLVHIWATWKGGSGNFSFPDYEAMRAETRAFDAIAAYESWGNVALTDGDVPTALTPNFVTPSYLEMLGARPIAGRLFVASEDVTSGAHPVVLLGERFWRRQFGGEPAVVDRAVHLNGLAFTVVGVVADGFKDLAALEGPMPDVWLPTTMAESVLGQPPLTDAYRIYWGLARLRPGASLADARRDLAGVAQRMAAARPATHRGYQLEAQPLTDRLRGPLAQPTMLLAGGALLILVMGCANAANLLLARTADRRREIAIRRALGASETMLLRQLLVEALCLAGLGGILGVACAAAATRALRAWLFENVSPFVDLRLDGPTLAGAAALCLGTAALFGLAPALAARGRGVSAGAAAGARGSEDGRTLGRRLLVAAQVGLSVVLLAGAGLMARSLHALTTIGLGFPTHDLVTLRLDLGARRYSAPEARTRFTATLLEKARSEPDIATTTLWGPSLLGNATWVLTVVPAERTVEAAGAYAMAFRHSVNPGGLANLGIPLRAGRDFGPQDAAGTPLVAIVSDSFARELWPQGDAVGRQMKRQDPRLPPITVVGIASDARHRQRYSLGDIAEGFGPGGLGPQRDVYLPYAQRPNTSLTLAVRARTDTARATDGLRRVVASLDKDLPLTDVRTLDDRLAAQDVAPAALTGLLGAYAAVAVLLTALGLYGVLAHSVAQRTREIGIRMALGAQRSAILRLVFREGLGLTLLGASGGLLGALAGTRLMRALLFGVAPGDPWTLAAVIAILVGVAVLAMLWPVRRATRVDPVVALRTE